MNNSPNPTPSVTEEMIEAGGNALWSILDLNGHTLDGVNRAAEACYLAMKASAPQHTGVTDVGRGKLLADLQWYIDNWPQKRLLAKTCRDAIDEIEQLRAALLVSNSGAEGECDHYKMVSGGNGPWRCVKCGAIDPPRPKYEAALDTTTIDEGEGRG